MTHIKYMGSFVKQNSEKFRNRNSNITGYKNEHYHGGAARRASSSMASVIEVKPSPNYVRNGMVEGAVEGLYFIF